MMPSSQPPVGGPKRTVAIVLLILATVGYGLSLLPWALMTLMSPMLYDSPDNATTATVLILGLLGWPVVILAGLIIGWVRRTTRTAVIALVAPLVWALIVVAAVEVVNPAFFSLADLRPAPRTLKAEDRSLGAVALGAAPGAVVGAIGEPEQLTVDGDAVPPAEAADRTAKTGTGGWKYPSRGLTVTFMGGKVTRVQAESPWSGKTPRGVGQGDTMAQVGTVYGEPAYGGTSTGPDGVAQTFTYLGKGFQLRIFGDKAGKAESFVLSVED